MFIGIFFKISVTIYMFNKLICLLKQCKKEKICNVLLFFVFASFLDKTWETKAKLIRVQLETLQKVREAFKMKL